VSLLTLKKISLIVIAIIVAIIIGFALWTITPYFINTTIDEPLPTSSLEVPTVVEKQEMIRVSTNVTDNDED
jgi:cytoskeletal protein RodZ